MSIFTRFNEIIELSKYVSDADLYQLSMAFQNILDFKQLWADRYYSKRRKRLVKEHELSWGLSYFLRMFLITPKFCVEVGSLYLFSYMVCRDMIKPTTEYADIAAKNGYMHILQYLTKCRSKIRPTKLGLHNAIANGHVNILIYLEGLNPPIIPTEFNPPCIGDIDKYSTIRMIQHFIDRGIKLNSAIADKFAEAGRLDLLRRYESHVGLSIYGLQLAALNGHSNILIDVITKHPNQRFDSNIADVAAINGHDDILDILESLTPPVRCSQMGANYAAIHGHLNVIRRLKTYNPPIIPSKHAIETVAQNGHLRPYGNNLRKHCKLI